MDTEPDLPLLLLLTPTAHPPPTLSVLSTHGFSPVHVPAPTSSSVAYIIDHLSNSTPYGIVAYGDACDPALELAVSPSRNLRIVVCYNPPNSAVTRGDVYRDGIQVILHLSRLDSQAGKGSGGAGAGFEEGHEGMVYWYENDEVGELNKLAMTRTLGALKTKLGGCAGVEEAVGLEARGVVRRIIGVDGVVDETQGRCIVRDVVGGVVVAKREYLTREEWRRLEDEERKSSQKSEGRTVDFGLISQPWVEVADHS